MKNNFSCTQCNAIFLRYESSVRDPKRVFCSRECQSKWQKVALAGKNNPGYKTGKYVTPTCVCGQSKDARSKLCSECSGVSAKKGTIRTTDGWALAIRSDDDVEYAVEKCRSINEAASFLNVSRNWLAKRIKSLQLDIEHFRRCKHRQTTVTSLRPNSNITAQTLKKVIITNDLIEYICCECGQLPQWKGKSMTLELHHLNGNNHDNSLDNLVFLCPNCHSQTSNSRGKNYGKRSKRSSR